MCLITASASLSVVKPSCKPPDDTLDTRYSRVSGWNDRRMLCDTLTGCSSNQYQRGRLRSKSVVKYRGIPLLTASSRLLFRWKSKRASSFQPVLSDCSEARWTAIESAYAAPGTASHTASAIQS